MKSTAKLSQEEGDEEERETEHANRKGEEMDKELSLHPSIRVKPSRQHDPVRKQRFQCNDQTLVATIDLLSGGGKGPSIASHVNANANAAIEAKKCKQRAGSESRSTRREQAVLDDRLRTPIDPNDALIHL